MRVKQVDGLQAKVRQRQAAVTGNKAASRGDKTANLKEAFRNEDGAIDLASIMVGIIVIGLIGGVIAATVFAVIPWSQDNAAKHQLDSIVAAQSAYMGLSSDSSPVLPAGHQANSFGDSASLASANLIQAGSTYCTVLTNSGKGYQGLSQSSSGKVWSVTDNNTKPSNLGQGSIAPDCSFVAGPANDSDAGNNEPEVPYVDPTPTKTVMTYKCDTPITGAIPMHTKLTGTETWNDGAAPIVYSNSALPTSRSFEAGKEYIVTFDGTYSNFQSNKTTDSSNLSACLVSVDHWGASTNVIDATQAFYNTKKLSSVPDHIPSTITNMKSMFHTANINDPSVGKWNVSNVTNMSNMFYKAGLFNQPLNSWNTGKVLEMNDMFNEADSFNQPLEKWDMSKVASTRTMFAYTDVFDQPLGKWDMGSVKMMNSMFIGAKAFNQNIDGWNVSSVINMNSMFANTLVFNEPLLNWDTSNVTSMDYLFSGAKSFNQNIKDWKVGNVLYKTDFRTGSALTAANSPF